MYSLIDKLTSTCIVHSDWETLFSFSSGLMEIDLENNLYLTPAVGGSAGVWDQACLAGVDQADNMQDAQVNANLRYTANASFSVSMSQILHGTHTKKLLVIYMKFRFN